MSRIDEITGKKALKGHKRSHAMNATNRHFKLNLQNVSMMVNGQKKNVRVTAKTARTLRKKGMLV